MAKQYNIIWRNIDLNDNSERIDMITVNDVQFKDQYIQIDLEDAENTVLYIPYYRIIRIKRTGQDEVEEPYLGH